MKLSWLLTLPVALLVALFALSNRHDIPVSLFPFFDSVPQPLYLLTLFIALAAFFLGGIVVWIAGSSSRRKRSDLARRVRSMEAELARMTGLKS